MQGGFFMVHQNLSPWLQIASRTIHLEELPQLLERFKLLVPLLRSLLIEESISSINVSKDDQLKMQTKFLTDNQIDSPEKLSLWLKSRGLTEKQASANVLQALQLETFKNDRFTSDIPRIFMETKDQRDRVIYSLLRVKSQAAAQELYLSLEEGDATFTDLCQEHSSGPERETGGLIGPVEMSRLHPQIAEMLRISQPAQLWPPCQLEDWWVVVRLDKKIPAQLNSHMERRIRDECFEAWVKQQIDKFLELYNSQSSSDNDPPALD